MKHICVHDTVQHMFEGIKICIDKNSKEKKSKGINNES